MAGTIDQLNFEVLIKDDQFKEKVNADLALAKELNVQLSTLLDLQSKLPKIKITSESSSRTVVKDTMDAAIAEERRATAVANRVAAEQRAAAATSNAASAEQRRLTSIENRVAAEHRAAKAATDAAAAEERKAAAVANKTAAEQRAIKATTDAVAAEERKAAASANRVAAEQRASAATSNAAAAATRATTALTNQSAAESRAAKAATDAAAAQERQAAASANRAAAESRAAKAAAQAAKAQLQLNDAMRRSNKTATTQSRLLGELKSMAMMYFSIRGGWQLIQSLVRITGEFELQRAALGAMIGDLTKARLLVADIQELAVKSPFAFKELTSYTKQLAAFSVPTDELFETTKMLADVSAGLGVGMDRIILAYGQIRSAAFLRGQEVRQLTEAGIPILKELAKQFEEVEGRAVSAGEVLDKISARLVPFEMVAKVFKDMASEGGKFYEMQELQAETLRGKVMNLKDAYEIMMNEIGSANDERLKGAVDNIRGLMQNWERVGTILKTLIISYGSYKAALLLVAAAEKAMLAVDSFRRWQRLQSYLLATTGQVNKLRTSMAVFGVTSKAALGGVVAIIAAIATVTISAIKNANKLNRELEEIGGNAAEGVSKSVTDLERLVENLSKATEGTQAYRDIISEINRKYEDFLPNQLKEAEGYDAIAAAAEKAEQAIRNKARADAEAEGLAAIEKESRKKLNERTENFVNSLVNMGAGITKRMARDIKASFDAALLKEGATDDILATFTSVADQYLGVGEFDKMLTKIAGIDAHQAELIGKNIEKYAKIRDKVNYMLEVFQKDLDDMFDSNYSTKEERLGVEKIEEEFRTAETALKGLTLTQKEYDKQLKELQIDRLEKLANFYTGLSRPEIASGYLAQAKALKGLQDGWRALINTTLEGMKLEKNTSFGLWADEYTQSVKYVEDLVSRYQEINKEMQMIKSFDTDMANKLKQNKKAIEEVAKALGINIQALIDSKKKGGGGKSPEQIELETQINMVKKLKQSYEELRDFLDDGQMRRILKALFPNAQEAWLENFDFDKVLLKMADELEKYDTKAASSLKDSIGKDSAKDLADLFEAFMKYKEAVDDWKAEDFNFYGGDEVGKILRDLEAEYKKIEDKRKKTLELLRKAEEGDAESVALLRETLGEEVWKKYVTEGKNAIRILAQWEKDSALFDAEDKAKEKASDILKKRMEEENIDLTDFADKSIAQVRELLKRLGELKTDIQNEIAAIEEGGLTDAERVRLAELVKELELLGKQADDTGEELEKKVGNVLEKIAKQTSKTFSSFGKEIVDFGNALKDDALVEWGERLTYTADFVGDLTGKISVLAKEMDDFEPGTKFKDLSEGAKGGIVGILASVALFAYKSIKDTVMQAMEYQDALTDATRKYHDTLLELRREDYSNIFGTDEMALAAENAKILTEAQKEYNDTLDEMNKKRVQGFRTNAFGGREGVKNQSLLDMLKEISEGQGWNLYEEDGGLNIEAVEAYYETFKKRLSRKQRKLVEEIIENSKALDDAAAQQAEYLTDLFSGVADNIADSMVEAFIESGNAAIDMGEIMSDVAKNMVADLIKSLFIKDILDKYQADLEKITTDETKDLDQKTTEALGVLATAMSEIEALTPVIQETIAKYFDYLGVGDEKESDKGLASGIKGITEDTANLLASYLNAIRADVSYARTIWERMDVSMQQIASALAGFSAPSLMEYQAKIESNTYNTMLATQSILSNLQSVMDYEGGTAAIRVS